MFCGLVSYSSEKPVFFEAPLGGKSQKMPIQSAKTEFHPSTQDSFIRSFYDKNIEEEPIIQKRYAMPIKHVTLEDCIAIAMEKNFKMKIFNAKESQWRWAFRNQTAQFAPSIFYGYDISNLNGAFLAGGVIPTRVNETPIESNFYLRFPLFDGGYRIFKRKSVKNQYDASKKDVGYTREQVLRDVSVSYYRLLAYKLGVRVLLRNYEEIQAQVMIAKKNGSEFDILRSEAFLSAASQLLSKKYAEYRTEQSAFANLLGVDVLDLVLPSEEVITQKTLVDKKLDIESIYQVAYQSRPDLDSMRLKIKSLENEKKTLYAGFAPHLDGYGSMGNVGTHRLGMIPSREIGVLFTMPFGRNMGAYEYTECNRYDSLIDEAKYNLQNHSRNIEQDIITAYYAINNSSQRSFDAEEQVVTSDKSLLMAFERLEKGGLYVDVWQTQLSKTDAKLNLINAIADYNVAQVNQLFNMGAISVYNLTENIAPNPVKEEMDIRLEK